MNLQNESRFGKARNPEIFHQINQRMKETKGKWWIERWNKLHTVPSSSGRFSNKLFERLRRFNEVIWLIEAGNSLILFQHKLRDSSLWSWIIWEGREENVEKPLLLEMRRDLRLVRLVISTGSSWRVWETMARDLREVRRPIWGGRWEIVEEVKREPISSSVTVEEKEGRR